MQKIFKLLIPISVLLFLVWTISKNGPLVWGQISTANLVVVLISMGFLSLTYLGGAFLWFLILKDFSKQVKFGEVFRIFIVSNFGRFLPGVALHYIARIYLSKSLGLKVSDRVSAVVLEAYYTLAGGIIVSLLALPIAVEFVAAPWLLYPAAAGLLIIIILASPRVAFLLASKLPFVGKHIPTKAGKTSTLHHVKLIGISVGLFLIYSLAFNILVSAFTGNSFSRLSETAGLLSASWVIGFLTPIAPGGLGVSDLSFAFMLQYFYNLSFASFIALTFRFLLFVVEGIMFVLVLKLSNFDLLNFKKISPEVAE